jgi:hypothetical protein
MSDRPRPPAVPAWTVRSVAVRTRSGADRLAQAYRRLLASRPPAPAVRRAQPCSNDQP